MEKKETMLYTDVIKRFQKGEKDFSNVRIVGGNFDGLNMVGISFKSSTLIDTTFLHANLTNSDFSACHIEMCGFSHSNLAGANFAKAKIELTGFMDTNLEKADFTDADLSFIPLFDSNHSAANFKNAKLFKVFYNVSEVTEEDFREGIRVLGTKLPHIRKWRAVALGTLVDKVKTQMEGFKFSYGKGLHSSKGYSAGQNLYSGSRENGQYSQHLKEMIYGIFGGYDLEKKTSKSYKR